MVRRAPEDDQAGALRTSLLIAAAPRNLRRWQGRFAARTRNHLTLHDLHQFWELARQAGFETRRLSGSLRCGASSWSVGSIWRRSGPPTPSRDSKRLKLTTHSVDRTAVSVFCGGVTARICPILRCLWCGTLTHPNRIVPRRSPRSVEKADRERSLLTTASGRFPVRGYSPLLSRIMDDQGERTPDRLTSDI